MKPNERNKKILTPLTNSASLPTQNSSFLTSMPDDLSFVSSQISKVDRHNYLLYFNQLKPWEKTGNPNRYSSSGKSNYEVLREFKLRNSKKKVDLKDINWAKQNYFNQDSLEDILDANAIKKKFMNKSDCKEPYIDLHTYASQNKQICVKNIIIDLMQKERNKIQNREKKRIEGLEHYNEELEEDKNKFDKFKRSLVNNLKEQDYELNNLVNENKVLLEHKKKLTQEYRLLLEEIEKAIRKILAMKQYAEFVSSILGKTPITFPKTIENISTVNSSNNREKELENYTTQILKGYNCILDSSKNTSESFLDNPDALMNIFVTSEENILKLIEEKEDTEKDRIKQAKSDQKILEDLSTRLEELSNIVDKMKEEKELMEKSVHAVYLIENNEDVKFSDEMLREIDSELNIYFNYSLKSLYYVPNTLDIINKLTKNLAHLDDQVNFYIKTINRFEDKEKVETIVKNRKEFNKEVRHEIDRLAKEEAEKARKARIERKANSIVILGRNRYGNPIPPNLAKRKLELAQGVKEVKEDDKEMLDY